VRDKERGDAAKEKELKGKSEPEKKKKKEKEAEEEPGTGTKPEAEEKPLAKNCQKEVINDRSEEMNHANRNTGGSDSVVTSTREATHKCQLVFNCNCQELPTCWKRCNVLTGDHSPLSKSTVEDTKLDLYIQQHTKLSKLQQLLPFMPFDLVLSNYISNPPPNVTTKAQAERRVTTYLEKCKQQLEMLIGSKLDFQPANTTTTHQLNNTNQQTHQTT